MINKINKMTSNELSGGRVKGQRGLTGACCLSRTRRAGSALDALEDPVPSSFLDVGRKPPGAAMREFDDIFENRPSARAERERGGTALRPSSLANGSNGYDIDDAIEEVSSNMKRLRASRAARLAEELEEEMDSVATRRRNQVASKSEREASLADRALESVGLRKLDLDSDSGSSLLKKRTLRITQETESSSASPELTKWTKVNPGTPLALETAAEAAAINRARQTRNRLQDLESEMGEMAERSAFRERRVAGLRSLVSETTTEKKVVSF